MDETTIRRLNAINQEFYASAADRFEELRRGAWPGWKRFVPYLRSEMSILDVACGNGRFGQFAMKHTGPSLRYYGLDSNARLLEHARASLNGPGIHLEQRDIVEPPLVLAASDGSFDLIVLFGVIHHLPGADRRQALLTMLAHRLAPGGILAFACWRFYEYPRFWDRIIAWPEDYKVETNDFLLDWQRGKHAIRYCHYVDDVEHAQLITATGLTVVDDYRADGESGDANRYTLLRTKAGSRRKVETDRGGQKQLAT